MSARLAHARCGFRVRSGLEGKASVKEWKGVTAGGQQERRVLNEGAGASSGEVLASRGVGGADGFGAGGVSSAGGPPECPQEALGPGWNA